MTLAGRRVLITRAVEDAGSLKAALEAEGADVVVLPTLVRTPPDDLGALARAGERIQAADAIAVGAVSALRPLVDHIAAPCSAVLGCVGQKTADGIDAEPALRRLFVGPRVVPEVFRAEALADALLAHFNGLKGRRVFVPRASEGRPTLVERLQAAGAIVDEVITYRIRPAQAPDAATWAAAQTVDAALFLSGETLANLLKIVPEPEARRLLDGAVVAVIGPVAEARAKALGIRVDVVPDTATQVALIDAVAARLALSKPRNS